MPPLDFFYLKNIDGTTREQIKKLVEDADASLIFIFLTFRGNNESVVRSKRASDKGAGSGSGGMLIKKHEGEPRK